MLATGMVNAIAIFCSDPFTSLGIYSIPVGQMIRFVLNRGPFADACSAHCLGACLAGRRCPMVASQAPESAMLPYSKEAALLDGGFRDGNAGGVDADMAGDAAREMDIFDSHFGEFGLCQLKPSPHLLIALQSSGDVDLQL